MMCLCDKEFAEKYLPHQINYGTELETKSQIPVTLGFQPNICNTCRNLPEEVQPVAEIYGRTSKISRYYWREIGMGTIKKFAEWARENGYDDWLKALVAHQDVYHAIEREVTEEIRKLHRNAPKYQYTEEESPNEVITNYKVEVVALDGEYVKMPEAGAFILDGDEAYPPEEYVMRHYERQGYNVLFTESVPFHALFGVLIWLLIEDPRDPRNRMIRFGNRDDFESGKETGQIWMNLPEDFGTAHYAHRRVDAIEHHFSSHLSGNKDDILWLFDYWTPHSENLRQYLWAHRIEDIQRARQIITILPKAEIIQILRYLIGDYWSRYLGWPDLLVYNKDSFFFAEVKSSSDKLREDQKTWIRGNSDELHLPFKLIKIHKKKVVDWSTKE